MLGQKGKDMEVECKKSWTVGDLKDYIQQQTEVEKDQQKVLFKMKGSGEKGWVPPNTKTLGSL